LWRLFAPTPPHTMHTAAPEGRPGGGRFNDRIFCR
jgi:hypothetical protein